MDSNEKTDLPPDLAAADLAVGDVLRDRQRDTYFKISRIDEHGVGLHTADAEFYVPHAWFVAKYDARLHPIDESESLDAPDWA